MPIFEISLLRFIRKLLSVINNRLYQLIVMVKYTIMSRRGVCINIGCGEDIRMGWINCDLFPKSDVVKKFDIRNIDDLNWLSSNPSYLIECDHLIGYVNYIQCKNFFKACFDSLELKGKLVIEFPDITKIAKKIIKIDNKIIDINDYIEQIRAVYAYDHNDAYDLFFNKPTYISGYSSNLVINML